MATLIELRQEIERDMRRGKSFARVEDDTIERSDLSEEEKSALWLYAWSFVDSGAQRQEARAHISELESGI